MKWVWLLDSDLNLLSANQAWTNFPTVNGILTDKSFSKGFWPLTAQLRLPASTRAEQPLLSTTKSCHGGCGGPPWGRPMSVARTAQVESLVTCHICCSLSSSQTGHFQIRSKPGLGDVLSSTLLAVLQQGRLRCGSVYGVLCQQFEPLQVPRFQKCSSNWGAYSVSASSCF